MKNTKKYILVIDEVNLHHFGTRNDLVYRNEFINRFKCSPESPKGQHIIETWTENNSYYDNYFEEHVDDVYWFVVDFEDDVIIPVKNRLKPKIRRKRKV